MRVRFILALLALTLVAAGTPQAAHAGSTGIVISRLELRGAAMSDETVTCVYENQGAAMLPDVATEYRSTVPTSLLGALFLASSAFACLALMRGRMPAPLTR